MISNSLPSLQKYSQLGPASTGTSDYSGWLTLRRVRRPFDMLNPCLL